MTGNQQKEKNCKKYKHLETKQHATKQPVDHWRNQRRNLKIPRGKWQQRSDNPKLMGCSKSHSKRKVCSNTSPPQETRKVSNKQANFTSKAARERRTDRQDLKLAEGKKS